ncbi:HAMP domain-containing histidine kinase [Mycoplasmatota bacterium]|nr:HAMP domain-containing histidine kinase [Mycoplasmatota bacterium]
MRKPKKLSLQLFVSTLAVMILMISVMFIIPKLFFDEFYYNFKTKKVNAALDEVVYHIENNELSYNELYDYSMDLSLTHNTFIKLVYENGQEVSKLLWEKEPWYRIHGRLDDLTEIEFFLNRFQIFSFINKTSLDTNEEYHIQYSSQKDGTIIVDFLYEVTNGKITYKENDSMKLTVISVSDTTFEEIDLYLKQYRVSNSIYYNDIKNLSLLYKDRKTKGFSSEREIYDVKGNKIIMNTTISYQPIFESVDALSSFYPYLLIIALFTSLLVAWLYSRKVSRPINKISDISIKMANLQFENIDIRQNNEIGIISENLNILSENLKQALSELTIANEKLKLDIKDKIKQEKIRKEFTANISHELKTPLGVLHCYVEGLKEKISEERKSEYISIILSEIKKMNILIKQMLLLAKTEAGDARLKIHEFNLRDVISDAATVHQLIAHDRNMEINIKGDFLPIKADLQSMEQVFNNLISNAVNHGLENTEINIVGEVSNRICRVSVVNACDKITQEEAERLFERFHMKDKSHTKQGTGLGLAICKSIFVLHNLTYGIKSYGEKLKIWFEYSDDIKKSEL